jgi:hypothetical protein
LIIHLANLTGPITLETTTPYGQSYDSGTKFQRCAHKGGKKSAGNKIIGGEYHWG